MRPIELHETRVKDLDLNKGTNNIQTAKWGSPRRTERLKPSTLAMLKTHISRENLRLNSRLFPRMKPKRMGEQWIRAKKKSGKETARPNHSEIQIV